MDAKVNDPLPIPIPSRPKKHQVAIFAALVALAFVGAMVDLKKTVTVAPEAKAGPAPIPPSPNADNAPAPPGQAPEQKKATASSPKSQQSPGSEPARSPVAVTPAQPKAPVTSNSQTGGATTGPVTIQPGAVVSFGQQGGQTAGTIINNAPAERHLKTSQKQSLAAIATTLPESASEWLSVEHANDGESGTFAKEIHEALSNGRKIKALITRLSEPDPRLRGLFVTVASEMDEHFIYAQQIANVIGSSDIPVHFVPPSDPKPGIVKVIVLRAEPMQPSMWSEPPAK